MRIKQLCGWCGDMRIIKEGDMYKCINCLTSKKTLNELLESYMEFDYIEELIKYFSTPSLMEKYDNAGVMSGDFYKLFENVKPSHIDFTYDEYGELENFDLYWTIYIDNEKYILSIEHTPYTDEQLIIGLVDKVPETAEVVSYTAYKNREFPNGVNGAIWYMYYPLKRKK